MRDSRIPPIEEVLEIADRIDRAADEIVRAVGSQILPELKRGENGLDVAIFDPLGDAVDLVTYLELQDDEYAAVAARVAWAFQDAGYSVALVGAGQETRLAVWWTRAEEPVEGADVVEEEAAAA